MKSAGLCSFLPVQSSCLGWALCSLHVWDNHWQQTGHPQQLDIPQPRSTHSHRVTKSLRMENNSKVIKVQPLTGCHHTREPGRSRVNAKSCSGFSAEMIQEPHRHLGSCSEEKQPTSLSVRSPKHLSFPSRGKVPPGAALGGAAAAPGWR